MKVTKDESAVRQVTLTVALDSEDLEPFLDRAFRRNRNRVSIPGFRPGKAPRRIVETFLGREALVRDSLDYIVQESLDKAISDEGLDIFGQPDVEVVDVDPVSFKATVPLEPVIQLGDLHQIDVAREPVEITEEQVGKVLESLRYNAAPWEPAERPVQFGDLVTLDVEGTIAGRQVANDQGVDFLPAQDNPYPFPGFSVYLEGLAEGQSKQFTLKVPEDYQDDSIAGEDCTFDVKVLQIKTKNLPDLDDEFAKGIEEGYESLEALKVSVRENLTEEATRYAEREFQESTLEKVISEASIEISDTTTEREIDHILEEQARGQQGSDASVEDYLANLGKSREESREELRTSAVERLSRFLVIRKLAQDENLEVDPEEVDSEIDRMATGAGAGSEAILRAFSSEDARSSIRTVLLTRKVLERLTQIVEGTESTESGLEDSDVQEAASELEDEDAQDASAAASAGSEETKETTPSNG
ncbi:MAG: trigger factor [Dehalococcoidia bacterium]|nr:trigger factor [Dehalococcoidia bacterium]